MIDLYTAPTPNGLKISVALEELGLPYHTIRVRIGRGEQHAPEFHALNLNHKIPVIVDHDVEGGPFTVVESGAILIYLADKTGKLLPQEPRARSTVLQWLMFQMASVGPMFGQLNHFASFAPEKLPYAIERYRNEAKRLLGVMDERLSTVDYLGGDYSIADIATYPWVRSLIDLHDSDPTYMAERGAVRAWLERVGTRPPVERGMASMAS